MPKPAIYILAGLLLIGALPLPWYGYYTLLRIVACAGFAWAAYAAYEKGSAWLPWAFGLLAILFNPVIKVYFPKEVWIIVDVVAGGFLLFFRGGISGEITSNQE